MRDVAHAVAAGEVVRALGSDADSGLGEDEAARRAARFGPNTLQGRRRISRLRILRNQLASPVVYLLGAAAALAFWFGELEEGPAILLVLLANTAIGYATEARAAYSIDALRALGSPLARVLRAGAPRMLPAADLVPGDIVLVEAGDAVGADLRIVESAGLAADESTFTGESVAADKAVAPVAAEARTADRHSMLFKGTTVVRGSGRGVVVATGQASELGRIAGLVAAAEPERSPLEKGLARLSSQLVWATMALAGVIAAAGLAQGTEAVLIVTTAIALAVAAIPEGLPVVATLVLARGMWRMAQHDALVERLPAVETLGATTVILTDKTGTLTENRMTVRRIAPASGEQKSEAGMPLPPLPGLLGVAVLCNDAALGNGGGADNGDPMEQALLRAGREAGVERGALLARWPLVGKHAFDPARRMMATVHGGEAGSLLAVKGAPEAVLAASATIATDGGEAALTDCTREEWRRRIHAMGAEGLRVLAMARGLSRPGLQATGADPFAGLCFLGIVGLEDPPRADVPAAIRACREAGVRVVMVTGDHAVTALAIGREIGLVTPDGGVLEGAALAGLERGDRADLLGADIYARVNPAEKLQLVRAWQRQGAVVAMTGDGVNDAPALRQADIGIAMGRRGTDAAREAAAMILLDDAFPTIVSAIREGRVIFGNIRRFAAFLLSCNLSEVLVVGLAVLLALPLPLMPIQILYLNLVTDVFPAFALASGEGDAQVMQRPPRSPGEPILGRRQWRGIVLHGLVLTAGTLGSLLLARYWLGLEGRALVTTTFLTLAFAQLGHVFNMRPSGSSAWRNEITCNPWIWAALALCTALLAVPPYVPLLADTLMLAPIGLQAWSVVAAMSLAPLVLLQALKQVSRRPRAGGGEAGQGTDMLA